jgi:hypothetical protein
LAKTKTKRRKLMRWIKAVAEVACIVVSTTVILAIWISIASIILKFLEPR